MVYESYYGLSQAPFGLTPDVAFCFHHRSYTRAKAYMEYAVMREEGFLVVTGRPGMGKTTLIQDLLADLGSERRLVARIHSTQLDADDLLRLVGYAFGLPARGWDKATLLHGLGDLLRRLPRDAGTAILIVDEAQNLPDRALEELRLITNLQEGPRALIQIFLVGQESLRDVIRQHNLEQLQQRIVAACHLEPLDVTETRAYIRHRLLRAGWTGNPIFEAETLRLIHQATGGVPRLVNKVCDRLLLYGSVDELDRLRGKDARLVIGEFRSEFLEGVEPELTSVSAQGIEGSEAPTIEDLYWERERESQGEPEQQGALQAPRPDERGAPAGQLGTRQTQPARPTKELHSGSPETPSSGATQALRIPVLEGDSGSELERSEPVIMAKQPETPLLFEAEPSTMPSLDAGSRREVAAPRGRDPKPEGDSDQTSSGNRGRRYARRGSRRLALAAATVFLLGLGSLALALQIRYPVEVASQIDRLTDGARDRLSVLLGAADRRFDSSPDADSDSLDRPAESAATWTGDAPESTFASPGHSGTGGFAGAPQTAPVNHESFEIGLQPSTTSEHRENSVSLDRPSQSGDTPAPATIQDATPASAPPTPRAAPQSDSTPYDRLSPLGPPASAGAVSEDNRPPLEADALRSEDSLRDQTERDQLDPPAHPWEQPLPTMRPLSGTLGHETSDLDGPAQGGNGLVETPSDVRSPEGASDDGRLRALEVDLGGRGWKIQEQAEGKLILDLAEEVPFDVGSARLPDEARPVLNVLAEALLRRPDLRVTLVGHTDDSGPADYNRRLSLARARAVEGYLHRQGVPPSQTASKGVGKDSPRAEGGDRTAARDRRVEVIVQPLPE